MKAYKYDEIISCFLIEILQIFLLVFEVLMENVNVVVTLLIGKLQTF